MVRPSQLQQTDHHPYFLYLATCFAALAIRLLYLSSVYETPFFSNLQTNSRRYHEWALLILDGSAPRPPFDQPPGYAYIVALLYAAGGRSLELIAITQAALDACTCVLVAALARHWFGARTAALAATLAVLCSPMIYFSAEILPATLSVTLAVAATAAGVHKRWLSSGVLWALALTIRSEIILALPMAMIDGHWRGGHRGWSMICIPPILVLALFTTVNFVGSGRFVPLTLGGGLNLWLGNNPHADGVSPFVAGPLAATATAVLQSAGHDAVAADALFRWHAFEYWFHQPVAALELLGKKLAWTWTDRELPNTSDIEWQTAQSWLFHRPWFPIGFGIIGPAGIGGLLLSRHRRREMILLGGLVVVGLATCTIFFTNARFRLILLPPLICWAAHWLDQLVIHRNQIDRLSLAGVIGGLVLAWANLGGVGTYFIPQIEANTGVIEREAQHYSAAVAHLRKALAAMPEDAIAWVHLALALEQSGQIRSAVDAYLDGLVAAAGAPDLEEMARRCFARNKIPLQLLVDFRERTREAERHRVVEEIHRALNN